MVFKELQNKGDAELKELLIAERIKLHDARLKGARRELKQNHLVAVSRKLIAQINTLLASRKS